MRYFLVTRPAKEESVEASHTRATTGKSLMAHAGTYRLAGPGVLRKKALRTLAFIGNLKSNFHPGEMRLLIECRRVVLYGPTSVSSSPSRNSVIRLTLAFEIHCLRCYLVLCFHIVCISWHFIAIYKLVIMLGTTRSARCLTPCCCQ